MSWPRAAATAQLLADLAGGLVLKGWEVHVIAAGSDPGSHEGVHIHRAGGGDRHHGLWSRIANYLGFLFAARRQLAALLRPGDIVVLKTDPPLLAPILSPLVRRHGGRLVHWIQDIYPEIARRHAGAWTGLFLLPWRWARDRAWRAAEHCVVVGDDMRGPVEAAGVPAQRLTALSNWAPRELDQPAKPTEIAAMRREWGLAGNFLAVYSGNLGRVHEFTTILDAAALLQSEQGMVFLFVGDGPRYAEVRSAATALGLTNVRFLPSQPRSRLAATLAAADVHFVTLRPGYESLVNPSKLAGVLAAGRPAVWIGPTHSANAARLETAGCGAAFAPGTSADLAECLGRWQKDPVAVAQLGLAARACYTRDYTFAGALQTWDGLLHSLLAASRLET
ncbi:MAG: glycosyltransferase family 4 protein [Opitutales bacterium]